MKHAFFQSIEHCPHNSTLPLEEIVSQLAFNSDGLIPVITQDAQSKDVLMMAWMNETALRQTLTTQRVTYWSRSRQALWVKGETSGHTQSLVQLSFDCDGDAILCLVTQEGPACHTGRPNCFYLQVNEEGTHVVVNGDSA
ncbi:phosphoribosyl-AMP cyclohydrolase [Marinibactrum halimedae]|uniref:Phosphoribosyl-AMP cyclohydrolase n=1 Tax=Marinibactrum halimedae TaxID=1444977 RepID=A0AA37WLH9_9GAMM|nr:phosphoribosyl-AMP cyclohydrolase [Marinibactrum halimedae]MCD9459641.1 phosphoribosyl-AMP cyclohydrolase [Marinibactrum halimedae]GLS25668.1 hypothetical protein GCM10007877_13820 [Marinibactrum halimedae]